MNFSNAEGDEIFQMLVVHRFCTGNDTLQPSANVLQEGQRLVSQTMAGPWCNLPRCLVTKPSFINLYQFSLSVPPRFVSDFRTDNLPQWGDLVLETELYRLEDLEEFNSTNFDGLFKNREDVFSSEVDLVPTQPDNDPGHSHPAGPSIRSLSIRLVPIQGSLASLIPRPHSMPSPYIADPFRGPLACESFSTSKAIEIAPLSLQLKRPSFSRCTWIVPVRGVLPWDHASSARLVQRISSSRAAAMGDTITWIPDAVRSFWEFLVSLREGKMLGPIGLSFQQASGEVMSATRTLKNTDYLKIYHDISISLHLRTMIDIWEYNIAIGDTSEAYQRVSILKGRRLALLDEASKALFTL